MSTPSINYGTSVPPAPTGLKSGYAGNTAAVAVCYLCAKSLPSTYSRLSALALGAIAGLIVKIGHYILCAPEEPGMSSVECKQLIQTELYSLYAKRGVVGADAEGIVPSKGNTIFNTVNAIVQSTGRNHVLRSKNWIRFQIELIVDRHSSIIRIGSDGYFNTLFFDAENPDKVIGRGSIAKYIPSK